ADPHLTDATSMKRVRYTCGASPNATTPDSAWPYSCNNFCDATFCGDGIVMFVDFPTCWNGIVSGDLNGERVVQYVDQNVKQGVMNDLAYVDSTGKCPVKFPLKIPHITVRIHPLLKNPSSDGSTIWPSSCAGSTFPCQTQSEPPQSGPGSIGLQLSSD